MQVQVGMDIIDLNECQMIVFFHYFSLLKIKRHGWGIRCHPWRISSFMHPDAVYRQAEVK
jgi:hypothetical protein